MPEQQLKLALPEKTIERIIKGKPPSLVKKVGAYLIKSLLLLRNESPNEDWIDKKRVNIVPAIRNCLAN